MFMADSKLCSCVACLSTHKFGYQYITFSDKDGILRAQRRVRCPHSGRKSLEAVNLLNLITEHRTSAMETAEQPEDCSAMLGSLIPNERHFNPMWKEWEFIFLRLTTLLRHQVKQMKRLINLSN